MAGGERISELMRTRQRSAPSACDSAITSPLELPTTTRSAAGGGPPDSGALSSCRHSRRAGRRHRRPRPHPCSWRRTIAPPPTATSSPRRSFGASPPTECSRRACTSEAIDEFLREQRRLFARAVLVATRCSRAQRRGSDRPRSAPIVDAWSIAHESRQLVDLQSFNSSAVDRVGAAGARGRGTRLQRTLPVALGQQRIAAHLGVAGGKGAGSTASERLERLVRA